MNNTGVKTIAAHLPAPEDSPYNRLLLLDYKLTNDVDPPLVNEGVRIVNHRKRTDAGIPVLAAYTGVHF
jgi:hypothetical protein